MKLSERYYEKLNVKNENNLNGVLLQLEVTNYCNHQCSFCPNRNSLRPKKMMELSFARRIIEEASQFLGDNKKICFHMNGESLLYKDLPELVKLSKKLGYEYTFITTNGSVADNDFLKDLFLSGLDSIKFSVNAGDRETYKKVHGRDDFDKVMSAIEYSYNFRRETSANYKIYASCVGIKDNYHTLERLKERIEKYCDEVIFYYPCGYAGQNNNLAKQLRCDLSDLEIKTFEIKHTIPCNVLWNSINVTCEGFLSLCCSESDNRLIVEDLNGISLKDAWLGDKMKKIRDKHVKGDIKNTPCYSCVTDEDYKEEDMDIDLFELSIEERKKAKRIKKDIKNISYENTSNFFKNRAKRFNESNPYSVTMYQDNNPQLVEQRNKKEINKLIPLLELDSSSKILDIACGIGRWSDGIKVDIGEYCGIDFSEELIQLAQNRNKDQNNRFFLTGKANEVENILKENKKGYYNKILLIGILMYLNDNDLISTLNQINSICENNAVICIREPLAIDERLTLKNFYSEELKDNYSAIYRTRKEMNKFIENSLVTGGFKIIKEGLLFDDEELNNRKETAQYYYILKR